MAWKTRVMNVIAGFAAVFAMIQFFPVAMAWLVTPFLAVGFTLAHGMWLVHTTLFAFFISLPSLVKRAYRRVVTWFIWTKIKNFVVDNQGKIAIASSLVVITTAAVTALSIYRKHRKTMSKEALHETSTAVRIMTALQSLIGMTYMGASFFGENQLMKVMKESVNNSMLMTKIVEYFDRVKDEMGLMKMKPKVDEIVVGNGKKIDKSSLWVSKFHEKTRGENNWLWLKFENESKTLNDITFVQWLKSNSAIIDLVNDSLLRDWLLSVIKENSEGFLGAMGKWLSKKKPENMPSTIYNTNVDEAFKPVVDSVKETLKESVFAPIIEKHFGKSLLNIILMALPTLAFGIVKFLWVQRDFSPHRVIVTSLLCLTVFLFTIVEPVRDVVEQEMVEIVELREHDKEGVNRHGGKRWRAPGAGTRPKRRYKRLKLSDAEYKALQEISERTGIPIGALVRAKVDAKLGYDEETDTYTSDRPDDAIPIDYDDDDGGYGSDDADDFYRKMIKGYDEKLVSLSKDMGRVQGKLGQIAGNSDLSGVVESLRRATAQLESVARDVEVLKKDSGLSTEKFEQLKKELAEKSTKQSESDSIVQLREQLVEVQKFVEEKVKTLASPQKPVEKNKNVGATITASNPGHICHKCKTAFNSYGKLLKHVRNVHANQKEKLNRNKPRYDPIDLRKSYVEIQVRVDGKWVHQGGAVATNEGGGTHGYTKYHNVEGFKFGVESSENEVRCRIPGLTDPNETLATFDFKVLRFDGSNGRDQVVFEIPTNLVKTHLTRPKISDIPIDSYFVEGVGLVFENNKLSWCHFPGDLVDVDLESGQIKYELSTKPGDSGDPIFMWSVSQQAFVLVACHMQAGAPGEIPNIGRILHGSFNKLFRP